MVNQRLFLWAILGVILWLGYQAWMADYYPPVTTTPAATARNAADGDAAAPPGARFDETIPGLPQQPENAATQEAQSASPGQLPLPESDSQPEVHVVTDVLDLDIGLMGGTFRRADLPLYPKEKNQPDIPVRLFHAAGTHPFVLQSGLTGQGENQPDHLARYESEAREYRLRSNQDELKVPLTWRNEQGLVVTKTYTFRRGSYAIDLTYELRNEGTEEWRGASYVQFLRHYEPVKRSMWNVETYAFKGPAIYDGERYSKLDIDDEEDINLSQSVTDGWLAAMQHHFVAAAVPHAGQPYQYTLRANEGGDFLLSAVGPVRTVAPGGREEFSEVLYAGPKLQDQLNATGPELARTADYGKLHFISQPLFKLLALIHKLVGNWGWTIILVTFLIKLAFYPLSETSGRSMAKMRLLAPRIKNIQERYKDNREQLGRAMMEIYKREKINPLAGCLPMLVQIPVFLAFYWVLLESVELRQAPFMLWLNDLSSKDPFFILPLLMGGAMFAQFKLNPAPPDPMQAKIFMFMPIVMTVMFAFFPSGLVLYWLTNTLLSIAQQWNINRRIGAAKTT